VRGAQCLLSISYLLSVRLGLRSARCRITRMTACRCRLSPRSFSCRVVWDYGCGCVRRAAPAARPGPRPRARPVVVCRETRRVRVEATQPSDFYGTVVTRVCSMYRISAFGARRMRDRAMGSPVGARVDRTDDARARVRVGCVACDVRVAMVT
jgi:hypothetical protein